MNGRPHRLVIAVCTAAGLLSGGWLLLGGESRYEVRASFGNVAGLTKNSEVRIDGVRVGTVTELVLEADDSVSALLELDSAATPIGRDARAMIRSKNLLGQRLVDLEPGDPTRPLPSGGTIPRSRTGTPVDLDDLLAVLDADTRTRLRALVHEGGVALAGRGADFNDLLGELPSSLDGTRKLLDELGADNRALARMVLEGERVTGSLARERRSLGRLIGSARDSLGAFASRRGALRETLRRGPATLAQARRTLARLEGAAVPLRSAAARLRSTAAPLAGALDALRRVEPSGVAALRSAAEAAPQLDDLVTAATPLVRRLRPAARNLSRFAKAAGPVSRTLDTGIGDTLAALEGWTRAIQGRDGLGHYFRGQAHINRDLLESLVGSYLSPQGRREAGRRRGEGARRRGPARPRDGTEAPAGKGEAPAAGPPERERRLPLPPALDDLLEQPAPGGSGDEPVDLLLDYLLGR